MSWRTRPTVGRRAARLAALFAGAALSGCAAVGPNFTSPATPAVTTFAMKQDPAPREPVLTGDTRAGGAWWRALGSSDLDAVMDVALRDNQTVAEAVANLDQARQQALAERGARLPRVDANAGLERERINITSFGFSGFPNPTINLFSVGGTVSYDLDVFGGERRRIEASEAAAQAQARRADAAYLTLTGQVALRAVQIAGLRAEMNSVLAIIADDVRNNQIIAAAEAAGGEARSAKVGGQAQLAEDRALLPPLEQQLARARHDLALLVGRPPAAWAPPDFDFDAFTPPDSIPVSLPSALVHGRPDILAAEYDLRAATARVGVATAALYPDLNLAAGLTQAALTPGALFDFGATGYSYGVGLTAPIFHGGTLRADRRAAQARAQASLARYRQTVLGAFTQVSDVLTALAADDAEIAALTGESNAAEASLADARRAYDLGGGVFLSLNQAQRQLDHARLSLTQARGQRLADIVALYAATATDWRAAAPARPGA